MLLLILSACSVVPFALLPTCCMYIFVHLHALLEITWTAEVPCMGPYQQLSIALFQLASISAGDFGNSGEILSISKSWFSDIPPCVLGISGTAIRRNLILPCKFRSYRSFPSPRIHCRCSRNFLVPLARA